MSRPADRARAVHMTTLGLMPARSASRYQRSALLRLSAAWIIVVYVTTLHLMPAWQAQLNQDAAADVLPEFAAACKRDVTATTLSLALILSARRNQRSAASRSPLCAAA
mmetsp:Transcript_119263/g.372985  ORF Transcript_119263/g.372985 Transcript_119263/m.372985 type:complete len:109 (+) Transcript_119263:586-912(+)